MMKISTLIIVLILIVCTGCGTNNPPDIKDITIYTAEADSIIAAIQRYTLDHAALPQQLTDLVPEYVSSEAGLSLSEPATFLDYGVISNEHPGRRFNMEFHVAHVLCFYYGYIQTDTGKLNGTWECNDMTRIDM